MQKFLNVENLSFTYDNVVELLFKNVSFQIERGWTGIVGANGSGKTTLLKLLCGALEPNSGLLTIPGSCYYAEQRTDFSPNGFDNFFTSTEKLAFKIKESLQLEDEWQTKWDKLSHGERKRCQIAVALFKEPSVLAIDEPSNHLDFRSKQVLLNALKSFRGIGLLVSHDRELMDTLCQRTIFLNPPYINVRKCSYTVAAAEIGREEKSTLDSLIQAKREVKKLKRQVNKQKVKASRADKLNSKRNISSKDHDAKAKMDAARLSGKDKIEGQIHKHIKARLDNAQAAKNSIQVKKVWDQGITFNVEQASKIFPIIIPSTTLFLGKEKRLKTPELNIQYGDKIGIIGDNGSGKSTYMNHLVEFTKISKERIIYITQEIPFERSGQISNRILNFADERKGQIMAIIRRLGSDPSQVLQSAVPSPGEIRKLMLAEGIMQNPSIIIMDEPTNHMDLPSITCIENALIECPCAQLLVSHDLAFLENTVSSFWEFSQKSNNKYIICEKNSL
jgi:macrolide transport system ATP-binding/permease protein